MDKSESIKKSNDTANTVRPNLSLITWIINN